ncbi:MAG: glycerophosphodiester phosphodiesterase family protein [Chloroflexi bacterium]|nr:glycerophosphodiester phosphodiesterase family protein [Chloroflexota bacterium]
MRKFMNVAHRGASSYAPENTFAAYDKALAMGVHHIELDVHLTRDDHIVVIHDDTVDRTTDAQGRVADFTLAELRAMDAGGWFSAEYAGERIRSLGKTLEHYKGRLYFHIEIKQREIVGGLARRTIDMVRGYGLTDSVTITSFRKEWLEEAAAYDSVLPKGWLVPMGPAATWDDSIIEQSRELGLTQICPRADITTPDLVDRIRAEGFVVRCQGLYNEDLMRHVVDVGADGATVNFPDKMAEYLRVKGVSQT